MKAYHPIIIAFIVSLSICVESTAFEYSSFYESLSAKSIRSSFLECCPEDISNSTSTVGVTTLFYGKSFFYIHKADAETEKQLLLAYGDAIANSLRKDGFTIGAVSKPQTDKISKPMRYIIFGNNEINICDVVIFSHRLSEDEVKIEAIFREYPIK